MDNLGDRIWSEIGRLDDEIEDYQRENCVLRRQIVRLTTLLKQNNIPVPNLEKEERQMQYDGIQEELREFEADLTEFLAGIQKKGRNVDGDLNEQKDSDVSISRARSAREAELAWERKHHAYLERQITKTRNKLAQLQV